MRCEIKQLHCKALGSHHHLALCCYLLKLSVTFLADIWIGLVIIAVTAICGGIAYRIYKYWKNTH